MHLTIGRTAEQGARSVVWGALGPDGKDGLHVKEVMNGAYVVYQKVQEPSDFSISKEGFETQEKIWVRLAPRMSRRGGTLIPFIFPERDG